MRYSSLSWARAAVPLLSRRRRDPRETPKLLTEGAVPDGGPAIAADLKSTSLTDTHRSGRPRVRSCRLTTWRNVRRMPFRHPKPEEQGRSLREIRPRSRPSASKATAVDRDIPAIFASLGPGRGLDGGVRSLSMEQRQSWPTHDRAEADPPSPGRHEARRRTRTPRRQVGAENTAEGGDRPLLRALRPRPCGARWRSSDSRAAAHPSREGLQLAQSFTAESIEKVGDRPRRRSSRMPTPRAGFGRVTRSRSGCDRGERWPLVPQTAHPPAPPAPYAGAPASNLAGPVSRTPTAAGSVATNGGASEHGRIVSRRRLVRPPRSAAGSRLRFPGWRCRPAMLSRHEAVHSAGDASSSERTERSAAPQAYLAILPSCRRLQRATLPVNRVSRRRVCGPHPPLKARRRSRRRQRRKSRLAG